MSSALRRLNWILFSLICASSLWAWINLPELETYPIHWNARGEADGFSSKAGVAFVLSLMPITALFTHGLMLGLTKVESIKDSIKQSGPIYDIVWNGCLWLYLGINIFLSMIDASMLKNNAATMNSELFLRIIPFYRLSIPTYIIALPPTKLSRIYKHFCAIAAPNLWSLSCHHQKKSSSLIRAA